MPGVPLPFLVAWADRWAVEYDRSVLRFVNGATALAFVVAAVAVATGFVGVPAPLITGVGLLVFGLWGVLGVVAPAVGPARFVELVFYLWI